MNEITLKTLSGLTVVICIIDGLMVPVFGIFGIFGFLFCDSGPASTCYALLGGSFFIAVIDIILIIISATLIRKRRAEKALIFSLVIPIFLLLIFLYLKTFR